MATRPVNVHVDYLSHSDLLNREEV